MPAVGGKPLPAVLQQLLNRTFLATFRVQPRPASLADSMSVHEQIKSVVSPYGKIIHYRQSMCPVTKERLEKLHVLVEDLDSKPERVDTVARGEALLADSELSQLESAMLQKFDLNGRIQLEHATRNPERILSLKHLKV